MTMPGSFFKFTSKTSLALSMSSHLILSANSTHIHAYSHIYAYSHRYNAYTPGYKPMDEARIRWPASLQMINEDYAGPENSDLTEHSFCL
jgi:hypothetical protein